MLHDILSLLKFLKIYKRVHIIIKHYNILPYVLFDIAIWDTQIYCTQESDNIVTLMHKFDIIYICMYIVN